MSDEMLLSFINAKLRVYYKNLPELCEDLNLDPDVIVDRLKAINYIYSAQLNQFVHKDSLI
ncbi:MAG: DUF4250 domain-containing protein [Bacilli bacterium]|nr:DUF4250 domain-containing protein [Bacilli bacterium]